MKSVSQVFLYKDEPGGGAARITKVLCASGCAVDVDQHLFDVETAKACQEIRSPAKGLLAHDLHEGQEVNFGAVLAEIRTEAGRDTAAAPQAREPSGEILSDGPVVSHEAARILKDLGVDPASLGRALITSAVVRQKQDDPAAQNKTAAPEPRTPGWTALPRHKVQEAAALRGCAGGSYLSMVGAEMIWPGFKRRGVGFFENKILDLVVFESVQLMPGFPNLNAAYRHPDQIEHHKDIVPGVALHGGSNLVTYAVKRAALSDAASVREDILCGFRKYVQNKLMREDTAGATYTVTDLSTSGADFVLPLVPASQSCIIGITRSRDGFKLYAAFDHRITDGFEAARFLKALAGRIRKAAGGSAESCAYCGVAPNPAEPSTMLLPLQDGAGNVLLCCKTCWN